jgi:DnaJ domain
VNERERQSAEEFQRFLNRVWKGDVAPLLRGPRAGQRSTAARVLGAAAGLSGGVLDRLLGFRGRPFSRALCVLGSSVGAMLPDAWDWTWLREKAGPRERERVSATLEREVDRVSLDEARSLLGLHRDASLDDLRKAWREACLTWHPDRAADERDRREFQLRFIVLKRAYDRLHAALVSKPA